MTSVQLASASKTSLLEYIEQLKASEQEARVQTQNAVNIANYFSSVILGIETMLVNSPFMKDGKFFKTLFWVMTNFSVIKKLIEDIIQKIKDWRTEMQKLLEQQKAQQTTTPQ